MLVNVLLGLISRAALRSAWGSRTKQLAFRTPTHGFAATREAAMQAFARSWFGENAP